MGWVCTGEKVRLLEIDGVVIEEVQCVAIITPAEIMADLHTCSVFCKG